MHGLAFHDFMLSFNILLSEKTKPICLYLDYLQSARIYLLKECISIWSVHRVMPFYFPLQRESNESIICARESKLTSDDNVFFPRALEHTRNISLHCLFSFEYFTCNTLHFYR